MIWDQTIWLSDSVREEFLKMLILKNVSRQQQKTWKIAQPPNS